MFLKWRSHVRRINGLRAEARGLEPTLFRALDLVDPIFGLKLAVTSGSLARLLRPRLHQLLVVLQSPDS